MAPWVLHVDLDEFLAAVEVLRRPELAGLPVIVGGRGDPTERAVVSTASYAAREHGVRSGMPLRVAVRRSPDAVLLPVDAPVYEAASEQVMATLRAWPGATVEVLGWDEAFVGVDVDDPQATADGLRAAVLEATGLHCSVGIGDTTVRAKNATTFGKPRGTHRLDRHRWLPEMGHRPVTELWGVGRRIGDRLGALGITTVAELALSDEDAMVAAFGSTMGPYYRGLGRGLGSSVVDPTPRVARAHGRETTYQRDLETPAEVHEAILELAARVVDDITAEGRACARVGLKVRFRPFFTVNRVRKLSEPTFDVAVVAATAEAMLAALEDDRPIRLLGVRAEMVPPTTS